MKSIFQFFDSIKSFFKEKIPLPKEMSKQEAINNLTLIWKRISSDDIKGAFERAIISYLDDVELIIDDDDEVNKKINELKSRLHPLQQNPQQNQFFRDQSHQQIQPLMQQQNPQQSLFLEIILNHLHQLYFKIQDCNRYLIHVSKIA